MTHLDVTYYSGRRIYSQLTLSSQNVLYVSTKQQIEILTAVKIAVPSTGHRAPQIRRNGLQTLASVGNL